MPLDGESLFWVHTRDTISLVTLVSNRHVDSRHPTEVGHGEPVSSAVELTCSRTLRMSSEHCIVVMSQIDTPFSLWVLYSMYYNVMRRRISQWHVPDSLNFGHKQIESSAARGLSTTHRNGHSRINPTSTSDHNLSGLGNGLKDYLIALGAGSIFAHGYDPKSKLVRLAI